MLAACSDNNNNNNKNDPDPEPISIETPNADRCEILDSSNCMFPWPSNVFTVASESTDTGLLVNLNQASMPANKQGVQVDPAEWNRNDGFSPSQMIVAQVPGVDLAQTGAPSITDLEQSLDPASPVVVIQRQHR